MSELGCTQRVTSDDLKPPQTPSSSDTSNDSLELEDGYR